ncbi:serine/threonine-protein kinase [Streptomyces sp. NBC_00893]|uniref:serine/threonine-protein kinase n=1 Tax=Streptomyces sp. NBC_00893 TaxID=2975862 RepID=UPI002256D9D2|nr:serine/threonine-protein kinase [Streptomyces sp. NBC_00893]MCX4847346.1 serine/threonine protein kinase [Streptomyces sp. NBC_00893]
MSAEAYAEPPLFQAVLVISVCALIVRLASLPLLFRAQRSLREREAAAFSGAPAAGAGRVVQFVRRASAVVLASALTVILPVLGVGFGLQDFERPLWTGNPLDMGGWILGIRGWNNSYFVLRQDVGITVSVCLVLCLLLWFLTRRNLLTFGMPPKLWTSSRTRKRLAIGSAGSVILLVAVVPMAVVVAALVFQAAAFAAGFRHRPPVAPAGPVPGVPHQAAPYVPGIHAAPTAPAAAPPPPAGHPGGGSAPGFEELYPHEPRAIGAYQLLGRIGAGGMGTVYVARRAGSATQVALKTIIPELLGNPDLLARFGREAEVLAMVPGTYTARVLDSGVDDGRPYLAMELLDGRPLDAHLRDPGPIRTPQALRALALALATALAGIHRLGLVHRDLKPGNIMLTSDGPRLLDFGIAAIVDRTRLTRTGGSPGTLTYMAPEQFDEAPPGPAADVWAWACCVLAAVHGDSPFAATTIGAVYRRINETGPDAAASAALQAADPHLATVVHRALTRDPAHRPADGTALLALLTEGPGHTAADPKAIHEEITRGWQTLPRA